MNRKELDNLITLGESQTLEFKKSVTKELGKEICAFANSSGGKVLIGVADNGNIHPLSDMNRLSSDIQNHARNCEPPISIMVETTSQIIMIHVPSSQDKPHASRGIFYIREGASSQRMSRSQIREYFFKEGLIFFDSAINYSYTLVNDLTENIYQSFAKKAGINTSLEHEQVLKNIGLLTPNGMTNAGCLLLSEKPNRFLVSATLSCALFLGKTKGKILDQKVYEGTISELYQNGLIYLQSHLNTEYIIGAEREELLELPEIVLREGLINALAHRDYRSTANVQIYIFQNRVEIVNPGGLVGGLTLDDLGKRSAPRNPLLFGILQRMGLVENIGSGLRRMREELAERKLPGLEFDVNDNWFSIIFNRSVRMSEKNREEPREKTREKILNIIQNQPKITIKELAGIIGLTVKGIDWQVSQLKKENLLKRIGPDKGGYWEVLK